VFLPQEQDTQQNTQQGRTQRTNSNTQAHQEQDTQQNTRQGRTQRTNSNTHAHRRETPAYTILTTEDSSLLIKKILTPDDGHIGRNM
jgi:hypothetical protein